MRLWPFPQGATSAVGWPGRPMLAHRQVLRMVCYLCKILCSLPPLPWPSWQQPPLQQAPTLGPREPGWWHSLALLPFEPSLGVSLAWG